MSIVYLHGFCSSPQSLKARQFFEHLTSLGRADEIVCPALSPVPAEAIAQIESALAAAPDANLIGSSLGGYYATYFAEKHGRRAALINPVAPGHLGTTELVGEHRNFHTDEAFIFTAAHLASLRTFTPAHITPDRHLLLAETDDQVLDYRISLAYYAECRHAVFPGGDHSFTRFVAQIPAILEFLDEPELANRPQRRDHPV